MKKLLFLGLAALCSLAQGQEKPLSSVALEVGRDNNGGTLGGLSAEFALRKDDYFSLHAATSQVKDHVTGEKSSVRSFGLGYTFGSQALFSFTPSLEVWGGRSDLQTRSFLLDVTVNLQDWSFGLQPEFKSLTWATAPTTGTTKAKPTRTGAGGARAHVDYYGINHWTFGVFGGALNYGGERFDNFYYSYLMTDAAITQSSGLVKSYVGASISAHYGDWTIGVHTARSTYLVGNVAANSVGLDVKYELSRNWTLGYGISSSKAEESPAVVTNVANIAFNW
jgi:hypothetical protein